jgi:hypothetical protein
VAVDCKDHRGRNVKAGSNEEDLRLIKSIELRHHFVKDCPRSFGAKYRRQPLEIPVLRFIVDEMNDLPDCEHGSAKAICVQGVSCPILAELAPRKIIVRSDGYWDSLPIHWGRIDQDKLDCQVLQLDLRRIRTWYVSLIPLECLAKRLIIVFTPPQVYTVLHGSTVSVTIERFMAVFAAQLSTACQLQDFPFDIVLVNFSVLEAQCPTNPLGTLEMPAGKQAACP